MPYVYRLVTKLLAGELAWRNGTDAFRAPGGIKSARVLPFQL